MKIFHNSQDIEYRFPFGAVKADSEVTLRIKTDCIADAFVRCWYKDTENKINMELKSSENEEYVYEAVLKMPCVPGLFWYYFIVRAGNETFYCSNNSQLGGTGEVTSYPTDKSFQITVYDKDFKTPEWFYDGVMYQIFPDRFFSDGDAFKKDYNEYYYHSDWYEPLKNIMHPFENGPANCDFYGGNIRGIIKKLPYLSELGVSVIYLNPVFESYSNHRYDTGDYKKIDPTLGTEEEFKELCEKALSCGIRIILDGVFSHTGSDSRYFNKYGRYGEGGAFKDRYSEFRQWYDMADDGSYKSWWGCSNLPNVNEMNPSYIDYILKSEDSVIKKWLRLGASGWRLDVADELPDEFIKILRKEAKSEKEDAVIIGEVWEDASNKVSYGSQREYLLGDELDSVMNYPFKDLFTGFLLMHIDAVDFAKGVMSIMENYPKPVLYSLMNLVGTHDNMRIKTVLGNPYIPDNLSFEEKQSFRLNCFEETLAIKRMMLIAFLQMTFVGVPCIYYGDEIGMQGLFDPFNRMPFTWRCIDPELLSCYKQLISVRNSLDCLRTGEFKVLYAEGDVIVYMRQIKDNKDALGRKKKSSQAICVINRGCEKKNIKIESVDINGSFESVQNGSQYNFENSFIIDVCDYSADILIKKE